MRNNANLPGRFLGAVADPAPCDHCDAPAHGRWQGETDSSGRETLTLCDPCAIAFVYACSEPRPGICDWCRQDAPDVVLVRDPDEGRNGPVYAVCVACRNQAAADAIAVARGDDPYEDDAYDEPYDDGDDDDDEFLRDDARCDYDRASAAWDAAWDEYGQAGGDPVMLLIAAAIAYDDLCIVRALAELSA